MSKPLKFEIELPDTSLELQGLYILAAAMDHVKDSAAGYEEYNETAKRMLDWAYARFVTDVPKTGNRNGT